MQGTYDIIIIGAGVTGAMIARFLARYNLKILWIEKAVDVCTGATAANSALIHGGYDTVPGTLKAEMNTKANPMWDQLAEELHFGFERCGTYVVAVGEEERTLLEELHLRGEANNIPTEIISGAEMRAREPNITSKTSGALYCSVGGICDPWGATLAAAENAVMNGVELKLNTEFLDFIWESGSAAQRAAVGGRRSIIGVKTNQGDFYGRWVINAAGLYADEVMHKADVRPEFKITARRGEYYVMDRAKVQINNVLFPVPTKVSKGILVTTTLHGNTLVGPNAQEINDKTDAAVTSGGMQEIWEGAQKLVPRLNQRDIIAVFAGLRPGGNAPCADPSIAYHKDFIIEIPEGVNGLVNLGGIESPGLTAAPAIAVRVTELLQEAGEALPEKPDWNPVRPARPIFRHLSHAEQAALVARDPRYGRVICRCETVTEGEIVAEIHAPIPATTYDAIKRRTWLGTGRCLGGFDMPRVVEILARELETSPLEISKKGQGSEFLTRLTKEVITC
ncbi:MAG: NAD(P)/FAD-dependent oxidoreductase [Anaerolineae bacterium]|nr:NAD(P)/FAD-dependent oxidoreductase [Anaerolineae bacterium]